VALPVEVGMLMAAWGRRLTTRRPRRRTSRSALALRWLALVVIVAIAIGYVQPLRAYRDVQQEVDARKLEVAHLARSNAALGRRIDEASTTAFVERKARRLGLVRPGERLFIVTGIDPWKRERRRAAEASLP
jgi:cell division protein FtsB